MIIHAGDVCWPGTRATARMTFVIGRRLSRVASQVKGTSTRLVCMSITSEVLS